MGQGRSELWELVWGKAEVDPTALARAIEHELESEPLDYRTRRLIHDSTEALERCWGKKRLREWLSRGSAWEKVEAIQRENFGDRGFQITKDQLMDRTEPEIVKEFLRDLGTRISGSVTLEIGGSIALILTGYLSRATEDIDIVDEVPPSIRVERQLLEQLERRYRLLLTQFQSHYLPAGWRDRLQYLGDFGVLKVYVVDVYDIVLGKLFSKREKDLDDLRAMKSRLDKGQLERKLIDTAGAFLNEPHLIECAERNWYILFGEKLPA